MRQADPRGRGGGKDARRQLGDIVIGHAAPPVMHIVELTDGGISRLLHFHEDQRGDGLDMLGRQAVHEPIHQIAPRPKAVASRLAPFGHPGHGPLKCMAVQVADRGQQGIDARIVRLGGRAGFDGAEGAAFDGHPNILRPAVGQQRMGRKDHDGPLLDFYV